jgi:uncharacterized protein with HEPN domain
VDHIGAFVEEGDFEGFLGSELIRSAVVQKLAIIGEAAARISQEVKGRHPQVPWPKIVAFRDILVHAYFGIDWDEVWQAARFRCPVLRAQVADILTTEFGGPEDAGLR